MCGGGGTLRVLAAAAAARKGSTLYIKEGCKILLKRRVGEQGDSNIAPSMTGNRGRGRFLSMLASHKKMSVMHECPSYVACIILPKVYAYKYVTVPANTIQRPIGTKEWCTGHVLGYGWYGSRMGQACIRNASGCIALVSADNLCLRLCRRGLSQCLGWLLNLPPSPTVHLVIRQPALTGGAYRALCARCARAVRALCEKLAVLHHREFGKFRRLKGRH